MSSEFFGSMLFSQQDAPLLTSGDTSYASHEATFEGSFPTLHEAQSRNPSLMNQGLKKKQPDLLSGLKKQEKT